jgi:HEAT repeat protein
MDVLKARLADTDLAIRRSAAFALARISDSAVVNSLIALKADPDEEIRMQVAVSVAASQHPDANTILMEYIEDSSSDVRRTAVDGLRERGVTDALAKLRFHVQNRDVGVRRAVLRATVELAGADGWEAWFPIWSNALYDADPEVKISAINGIVYRATDARVPSLIGGLATDPSPEVQQAALKALGATGAKAAIEYVARALFEGNADSKRAALEALAAINIEECRKPIQDFVRVESDPALQERANAIYDNLP